MAHSAVSEHSPVFHRQEELSEQLTAELRQALRASSSGS